MSVAYDHPLPSPGRCYACGAAAEGLSERWEEGEGAPLYRLACPRHRSHELPAPHGQPFPSPLPLPGWVRLVREPARFASEVVAGEVVRHPEDAARLLVPRLAREEVEVMVVLALDRQGHVLGIHEVARGGLDALAVSARDIYRVACALGASAVIIAHCHPSGSPLPSQHDDDMTAAVVLAGDVVGVALVDHLVVGSAHRWHSYLQSGRLERLRG